MYGALERSRFDSLNQKQTNQIQFNAFQIRNTYNKIANRPFTNNQKWKCENQKMEEEWKEQNRKCRVQC